MAELYLVEGLPCSGKSTASEFVADRLRSRGRNVVFVDEGTGEHPADYEFHAYVGRDELTSLPEGLRREIPQRGQAKGDGWVLPLCQFSGQELDLLMPYKIYDGLPWEREMPLMLDRWESFAQRAEPGTAYVFNCVLLQNPMCETMMRFGFPRERSQAYIMEIAKRIAPLDPAVIYLKNEDIAQSVQAASGERPGWLEAVISYHVNGAYGKSIGAQGFEGYIACLEERQRRELAILEALPVRRLVLENPQRDWARAYERVAGFLEA